ncbi:AbiH family protein, partial [Phascolarctobacterium faecium]|uniref:AbiH family protein n=1 Tax=Phascolarctobacterium faecium TaxID=33025 RepID=UPI002672EA1C
MNIILIGNGFDLAHGLPTTYTDFLTFLKRINTPPVKPTNFNPDLELLINDPENLDIIEKMRKLFLNNVWYN